MNIIMRIAIIFAKDIVDYEVVFTKYIHEP